MVGSTSRRGAAYFLCLLSSALDVAANGEGLALRSRESRREALSSHRGGHGKVRTNTGVEELVVTSAWDWTRKKAGRMPNSKPICAYRCA